MRGPKPQRTEPVPKSFLEGWYGRLRIRQPRQRGCFIWGLTVAEPVIFYGTEGGSPSMGLGGVTRYKRLLRKLFSLGFILLFAQNLFASGVKFRLVIDQTWAYPGKLVEVDISSEVDAVDSTLPNGQSLGGFSFLISYDYDNLNFFKARRGELLLQQNWEFFTYRLVSANACSTGCNANLIKLTAYPDINNGVPNLNWSRQNKGQLAVLEFRAPYNGFLACQFLPINWYWQDCHDNILSDSTQNTYWVVDSLYPAYGAAIDLATVFPANVSNCDTLSAVDAKRFLVFYNGGVEMSCYWTDIGDINLNGYSYEIADYILFDSYFLYGGTVFSNNPVYRQSQVAASDVYGDGIPLQVSDLVLMLRIITEGIENPFPKIVPPASDVVLSWSSTGGKLEIIVNSSVTLGGMFLRFKYDGDKATIAEPARAIDMKQRVNIADGEIRVLLNAEVTDGHLPAGQNRLIVNVDGKVELIEAQASSVDGRPLLVSNRAAMIPTGFSLSQNFPNPFNPSTSFTLSLPKTSRYAVKIYNLAGQVVKSFEGEAASGNRTFVWDGTDENGVPVSSGIYFYKAQAREFSQTKKMLLIR